MPVNNLFQLRQGSNTEWNSVNPILASGEPGWDITNKVLKIGDGVTSWSGLTNHKHSIIDINNFNSSVSGLLPSVSGSGYVSSTFNNNAYTISVSGLQPSGNYSVAGHSHSFEQVSTTGTYVNFLNTSGNLSVALSDIDTAISGKAAASHASQHAAGGSDPVTVSLSQIPVLFQDGDPHTLASMNEILYRFADLGWSDAITELGGVAWSQITSGVPSTFAPSAHKSSHATGGSDALSYSDIGAASALHAHNAVDITDFNSSVSGLLPITNIVGGNNVSVSTSGTTYTVAVTGSLGLTTEQVDDRVASLLVAGSGINLTYDDPNNLLTISVSGLTSSATIGDGSTNVISYNLNETLNVVGSGSTTVTYNDSTNTINIGSPSLIREYELVNSTKSTFSVTGGYALNNLDVYHNGIKLLASGDYTATNGTTFTLIQPAVSGDVVEWLGYSIVPRHQLILGEVRSDTVGNINYLGRAVAGSSEASGVWTIKKYTISDNGIDIATATASNAIWNNRLTETYL